MPTEELNVVMKASDILKKKDFEDNFRKILEIILKKEQALEKAVAGLQQTYNDLIDRISKEHEVSLGDLKTKTNQLFVGEKLSEMSAEQKNLFNSLKSEVDNLMDHKL